MKLIKNIAIAVACVVVVTLSMMLVAWAILIINPIL